jgi:carbamoyl-phosphate synthase large subunit
VSVRDSDKPRVLDVARLLIERGFSLVRHRRHRRLPQRPRAWPASASTRWPKGRPHIVDLIKNGEIVYIVNTTEASRRSPTPSRSGARRCSTADLLDHHPGAPALIQAIDSRNHPRVWSLQELHEELQA